MGDAHDLRSFVDRVVAHLEHRRLPDGHACAPAGAVADPYGCADALNLAWTIGDDLADDRWRHEAEHLSGLQQPDGLWRDPSHHPIHTTAHCAAALELAGRGVDRRLRALDHLGDPAALAAFLDGLDWAGDPWTASHQGAGVWAARHLAGEATPAWSRVYFDWLAGECDPVTGLWRRGFTDPVPGWDSAFPQLAGTFHYLFNHLHAGEPIPHPAELAWTAHRQLLDEAFPWASFAGFAEVDVVYCLHRAGRAAGSFGEYRDDLARFADRYVPFTTALDLTDPRGGGDLHLLFGVLCALTELQLALGDEAIHTERPLRMVLDRRPFV